MIRSTATFIIRRWCGAARCRSQFPRKGRVRRWRSGCGGDPERQFGRDTNRGWEWLGAARKFLRSQGNDPEETKRLLHKLASEGMFEKFLREGARDERELISRSTP